MIALKTLKKVFFYYTDKWVCCNRSFISYAQIKFLLYLLGLQKCDYNVITNGVVIERNQSIKYLSVVFG